MGDNRDMMYGGFCQNTPGVMAYGNYNYQLPPGALLNNSPYIDPYNNGMNQMYNNMQVPNQMYDNNPLIDINARINNLENRVKTLEQKVQSIGNNYQDDNSMYML